MHFWQTFCKIIDWRLHLWGWHPHPHPSGKSWIHHCSLHKNCSYMFIYIYNRITSVKSYVLIIILYLVWIGKYPNGIRLPLIQQKIEIFWQGKNSKSFRKWKLSLFRLNEFDWMAKWIFMKCHRIYGNVFFNFIDEQISQKWYHLYPEHLDVSVIFTKD